MGLKLAVNIYVSKKIDRAISHAPRRNRVRRKRALVSHRSYAFFFRSANRGFCFADNARYCMCFIMHDGIDKLN